MPQAHKVVHSVVAKQIIELYSNKEMKLKHLQLYKNKGMIIKY